MKLKNMWLLITAIAGCFVCLMIDRYIYDLPGYVDYVVGGAAIVMVIIFAVINKERLAQGNHNNQLRK